MLARFSRTRHPLAIRRLTGALLPKSVYFFIHVPNRHPDIYLQLASYIRSHIFYYFIKTRLLSSSRPVPFLFVPSGHLPSFLYLEPGLANHLCSWTRLP